VAISENYITILDTTVVDAGDAVFAAAKTGTAAVLNALQSGAKFAVWGYGVEPRPVYPPRGLAPADADNVKAATRLLTKLGPEGNSADVAAALLRAVGTIPQNASVLLAGRNSDTPAQGSGGNAGTPSASPVNTLAAGGQPPAAVLAAVSAASGGTYEAIVGANEISAYFFNQIRNTGTLVFAGTRNLSTSPLIGAAPSSGALVLAIYWTADGLATELPFTVQIQQPDEEPWTGSPSYAGGSYVIYNIRDAAEGEWAFSFKQKPDAPAATVKVQALIAG
jgi:hypothetical protein